MQPSSAHHHAHHHVCAWWKASLRTCITQASVRASLLKGGIASLLHLFACLLRAINDQLDALPLPHGPPGAWPSVVLAVGCSVGARYMPARRRLLLAVGVVAAARAVALELLQRRTMRRLSELHARLKLSVQAGFSNRNYGPG